MNILLHYSVHPFTDGRPRRRLECRTNAGRRRVRRSEARQAQGRPALLRDEGHRRRRRKGREAPEEGRLHPPTCSKPRERGHLLRDALRPHRSAALPRVLRRRRTFRSNRTRRRNGRKEVPQLLPGPYQRPPVRSRVRRGAPRHQA
ncbi:hypothetical protein L596_028196 [Steinernema carpocapsae]|uniref:Uncharacterized protein n=1 Tax=Steinernema carpocapsae TaxID=34508 RepID=A0A4U5LXP8_STECR|nr:hypothetical protein L596_028196 [Steinernema carpocapsae]